MELLFKIFFGTERDNFSQRGTKVIRMCNCSQFFFLVRSFHTFAFHTNMRVQVQVHMIGMISFLFISGNFCLFETYERLEMHCYLIQENNLRYRVDFL